MKNETREPAISLSPFWESCQRAFISILAELAPNVTKRHAEIATALESIQIESDVPVRYGPGRRARDLRALARAFVVKALCGYPSTKDFRLVLLADDALASVCGFWHGVPSESKFSRGFARFAKLNLADIVHARLVQKHFAEAVVPHLARDSSAIEGRERPLPKPKAEPKPKGRPGRKKGVPPKPKVLTRQERQLTQDYKSAIDELPVLCDWGAKKNSKGANQYWTGYKLHVDVLEDGCPLSVVLTSASVHDSQVAIPLMKMSTERVGCIFYHLMDVGYVGKSICQAAEQLDQVAIIPGKATKTAPAIPMDPNQKRRYSLRTVVERFFSDLKDNHGGNCIRVRGHPKVRLHLMFGVLAIFALKILAY